MTERRGKTLLKVAGRITLMLNLLAALALWACCASTWLHPADFPHLALAGLLFPIVLAVNLCFVLIWIPINYKRIWIPLATTLPCLGFLLDYCPMSFGSIEAPEGSIKLLTWNTANYGTEWEDKEEGRFLTTEYIKDSQADIICLQESSIWKEAIKDFSNSMDSMGYYSDRDHGTVLFSRYPILDGDTLQYDTKGDKGARTNSSKWYKLLIGGDTIVLVNNHLESNHLREEVKSRYVETLDRPEYEGIRESGHNIGSRLKKSTTLRGYQTDSLVLLTKRFETYPIIFCGDFNDTPISYTYQHLKRVLKSAYRESGKGIGLSYNQRGFWVRIDHIFVSEHWQTYNTHIDNSIRTSDHYPLVSWLKLR